MNQSNTGKAARRTYKKRKDNTQHKMEEFRRRARIRDRFSELRTISDCPKKDQFTILCHAIQKIAQQNDRIRELEGMLGQVGTMNQRRATVGQLPRTEMGAHSVGHLPVSQITPLPHGLQQLVKVHNQPKSHQNSPAVHMQQSPSVFLSEPSCFPAFPSGGMAVGVERVPSGGGGGCVPLDSNSAAVSLDLGGCAQALQTGQATAITTVDGRFVGCNVDFAYLTGYTKEELLQRSLFALTHVDSMPTALMAMDHKFQVVRGGSGIHDNGDNFKRKEGKLVTVELTVCAVTASPSSSEVLLVHKARGINA